MSKQTHVYLIPPCASQLNNNLFNKKADGSQIIWSLKILFHFEPAVVTPSVYKDLPKLKQLYDQIYLTS